MVLSTLTGEAPLDVIATEIRPSVALDMVAAHEVMTALRAQDVRRGGCWLFTASVWQRFDRPWSGPDAPDGAQLVGSIYVSHGTPTTYDATIDRVTVTPLGQHSGWSPERICDDALSLAGLSLVDCGLIDAAPTR